MNFNVAKAQARHRQTDSQAMRSQMNSPAPLLLHQNRDRASKSHVQEYSVLDELKDLKLNAEGGGLSKKSKMLHQHYGCCTKHAVALCINESENTTLFFDYYTFLRLLHFSSLQEKTNQLTLFLICQEENIIHAVKFVEQVSPKLLFCISLLLLHRLLV